MFRISKDHLQCHFFYSNLLFITSTFIVSNLITMFPIALNSLFPMYEFCFQFKFIVSNVFCFLSHNHFYHQSTYFRSKYFFNVKMNFEQFRYALCDEKIFNKAINDIIYVINGFIENFFLDFSKSVPAQKIALSTRFFA